ncbi:MAG TPA: PAS domain S-box protein [Syntrophorhabdaceae bacterium]
MGLPSFKSIKTQLLIIVLISILPALGIILYSGMVIQREAIREAEHEVLAVLNGLAAEHQLVEESTRQLLITVSQLPEVQHANLAACNKILQKLLIQNPVYGNLFITDPEGNMIAAGLPFTSHNVRHRKYFQDLLTTKDFSVGEYVIGMTFRKPELHFAYPTLDGKGRIKAVVVAGIDLTGYGRLFTKAKMPEGSDLIVTDHKGIKLLTYPDSPGLTGTADSAERIARMTQGPEEGTFARFTGSGKRLVAYRRFSLREDTIPYLFISVAISEKQALAGARGLLYHNLAFLAMAFLMAVAIALIVGKAAIAKRLDALVAASVRLGRGDLTARTGLPPGKDELGRLAEAFDEMADQLEHKEWARRQADEAFLSSQANLSAITESTDDWIWSVDPDRFGFLTFNTSIKEYFLGTRGIEIHTGTALEEVCPAERLETWRGFYRRALAEGRFQTEYRAKGNPKIFLLSLNAVHRAGEIIAISVLGKDITESHTAAEKLRESEEKYRSIFENAVEGIFQTTPEGRYLNMNPALARMYGYSSPEEMIGAVTDIEKQQYVNPEDRNRLKVLFGTQGFVERFETQIYRKGGDKLLISMNARAVKSATGEVAYYEGTVEDITARKEGEETLRESEETLRALINATRETLLMIDTSGTVLVANEVVAHRLGKTVRTLIGTRIYDHFAADVVESRKDHYEKAAATGEPVRFTDSMNGKIFDHFVYPVFNTDRAVVRIAIFANDITQSTRAWEEKGRLESQLRQAQKMEAIGTLAGGVAHDFNNILTAIIGYGSLLRMGMDGDPKKSYVDQILSSSHKAAVLTQSLLAFSRKQVIEPKPRKINEIIWEAEKLLKRLLTEDIEFTVVCADSDMTVRADVTQIDQVLINLATNARDAMPGGGKLVIETKSIELDDSFVQLHGFGQPGGYARVSVSDTGIGMDQQTREKIFEPFFTTKEVGKGTGLGLSLVYGIISQHNGYITVTSEPDKGTRFDIYLPIIKTRAMQAEQPPEEVKGGHETILVAEDNDQVRILAKEVLTSKGYTVIEATDGEDAVRQFREHKDEIVLLLLDVVMPRKNGREVYEEIAKARPDVKVLFTSGYTGDVVLIKGIHDEALNYISKPLAPNELLKKVREVLDR